MIDPLAEGVTLLQPTARFSKHVVGAGPWQVRRSDAGQPFYCLVLEGGCRLALDGHNPILLQTGDFVLIEALRSTAGTAASPGLVRGLADVRLAAAIHAMHQQPTRAWTIVRATSDGRRRNTHESRRPRRRQALRLTVGKLAPTVNPVRI